MVEHRFDVADKVLMISATVDKATGKIKTITVMGAPLNLNEQACLAMMYEVTICILNDGFTPKDANYIMRKKLRVPQIIVSESLVHNEYVDKKFKYEALSTGTKHKFLSIEPVE